MQNEIESLAQEKVEKILGCYVIEEDFLVLAAAGEEILFKDLLGLEPYLESQVRIITLQFLHEFERDLELRERPIAYAGEYPLGIIKRTSIVGLAAAAIGASMGICGADLHPILEGIVGAESALLLNVLATLLIEKDFRKHKIDGIDLAVLFTLGKGHYSPQEIADRISTNLDVNEIESSIEKVSKIELVKKGDWKNTYTLTEKGKAFIAKY